MESPKVRNPRGLITVGIVMLVFGCCGFGYINATVTAGATGTYPAQWFFVILGVSGLAIAWFARNSQKDEE